MVQLHSHYHTSCEVIYNCTYYSDDAKTFGSKKKVEGSD